MTTMKDIAKRAGVGLGTVSRVVNGTGPVSQETREKVEAALSEMNYRPNRIARKLVSGNTGRGFYGVLMPLFIHPFYFYVLRGVYRFVEEQDMNLILFNRGKHPEEAISHLMQEDILGLMVMSHGLSPEEEALLKNEKLDLCYLDYHQERSQGVWIDNHYGGRLAAEHFLARGCKAVAFVGDLGNSQQQIERFDGFSQTLEAAGNPLIARHLVPREYASADAVRRLLADHPETDGIFFFSDTHAVEALPALAEASKDIVVCGYDDLDFTRYLGLTTIHQPKEEMGYEGAKMLHRIVHGQAAPDDRTITLKPSLVTRGPLALGHFSEDQKR
jgi:LacI family transcriptional regulator